MACVWAAAGNKVTAAGRTVPSAQGPVHDLSAPLQRFDCNVAVADIAQYLWERAMPAKNHGHGLGLGVPARSHNESASITVLFARSVPL